MERRKADIGLETPRMCDVFKGQKFYQGFCYRTVKVQTLITDSSVRPTTEELERFNTRVGAK